MKVCIDSGSDKGGAYYIVIKICVLNEMANLDLTFLCESIVPNSEILLE